MYSFTSKVTRPPLVSMALMASIGIAFGHNPSFGSEFQLRGNDGMERNKTPKSQVGGFKNPDDNGLKDEYCSDDPNDSYPPCDDGFETACKNDGGTMSGTQGWGGKTCFKPL